MLFSLFSILSVATYDSTRTAAAKQEGPSKKEILRDIEAKGFDVAGFEGATKMALTRLLGVVAN